MKRIAIVTLTTFFCCALFSQKVLIFSKTAGYHHASIPAGIDAIKKIASENKFDIDTTTDASKFNDENLKQYKAIIFLSTTGDLFDTLQKQSLQKYVNNGGGIVGIHAATDAEFKWPWFGKLMGGYFESHPKQQTAKILVADPRHPATKPLPGIWTRWDEWYNYKELNDDLHVLLTLDERSYTGGKNGDFHPISWWREAGKARVFYTGLGHTDSSYIEPLFIQHLTGGILFVLHRSELTALRIPSMFDAKRGIDKFILGAQLSSLDTTTFTNAGGPYTVKGKVERYFSVPAIFQQPIIVGGVPFDNISLTFDGSGKLIKVWLFKMYQKQRVKDYKEVAATQYEELTAFMQSQFKKKGKKKKLQNYKDIRETGYEWVNGNSKTQISLYTDDGPQSIYDLRLQFELID